MELPKSPRLACHFLTPEDVGRVHEASLRILAGSRRARRRPGRPADAAAGGWRGSTRLRSLTRRRGDCRAPRWPCARGTFAVFDRSRRARHSPAATGRRASASASRTCITKTRRSGDIVPFRRRHMAASVRLGHALSQYDLVSTVGVVQDVPVERADLVATLEMVANTTQASCRCWSPTPASSAPPRPARGACAERGRKTLCAALRQPDHAPGAQRRDDGQDDGGHCARACRSSSPTMAWPARRRPMSPLRTLALLNAELLAGLVFSQAVRPGAAMVLGSLPAYFDMRTMVDFYDPRSMLMNLACAEMMAHYGLPHAGTSGSGNGWGPDVDRGGRALVQSPGRVAWAARDSCRLWGGTWGQRSFRPQSVVYGAEVIDQARAFAAGFDLARDGRCCSTRSRRSDRAAASWKPDTLRHLRTGYHTSRIFPHYGTGEVAGAGPAQCGSAAARRDLDLIGDGVRAGGSAKRCWPGERRGCASDRVVRDRTFVSRYPCLGV